MRELVNVPDDYVGFYIYVLCVDYGVVERIHVGHFCDVECLYFDNVGTKRQS